MHQLYTRTGLLLAVVFTLSAASWSFAQEDDAADLRRQLEEVMQRLEALERQQLEEANANEPQPTDEGGPFSLQKVLLPDSEGLEISGVIRLRGEYKDNLTDFAKDISDEQEFVLSRIRLRFDVHVLEDLDVVIEFQDSRQFGDEGGPVSTAREQQATDLSLGYLEVRNLLVEGLTLRAGRQKLSFGDQRLVGGFEYNNFANRFDALSLIYKLGTVGEGKKKKPMFWTHAFFSILEETNTQSDDTIFAGIYNQLNPIEEYTAELYYLLLNDMDQDGVRGENGLEGNRHIHTFGTRHNVEVGGFGATAEGMLQYGEYADDDVLAFAVALNARYKLDALPWKPQLGAYYTWASGDDDPNDGDRKTFENLFPTNHLYYGAVDLFSLQNVENIQGRIKFWPAEGLSFWIDYHFFRLADTEDFWYNAGRRAIRSSSSPRNTGRSSSNTVGQEIDLSVAYKLNGNVSFLLQYGHFFAGPYVKDTGNHSDADFVGLTAQVTF